MPRVKLNNAARSFLIEPHRLSDRTQVKLCQLLALHNVCQVPETDPVYGKVVASSPPTKAREILAQIENTLGLYRTGMKHLDNVPRPAHYVAAFDPVAKDAWKLFETLTQWSDFYTRQIITRVGSEGVAEIEAALASLVKIARGVVTDFKGRSSKGARPENAFCETLRSLRHIFRDRYAGPVTDRPRSGAVRKLSEQESRELQFLIVALADAKIIRNDDAGRAKVRRYLRDSRCALPASKHK